MLTLYIKNMVCNRCILAVKEVLDKLKLSNSKVQLGEVELVKEPTENQLAQLKNSLTYLGFEILDDSKRKIIERIKTIIVEQVHYNTADENKNLSDVLTQKLHRDYSFLSNLFSSVEGITIEKYVINQKIEKVKELIIYNEMNLGEIAFQLGYSSVAHLSAQFKKVTGLTPSHFKKAGGQRKSIDTV